ncbi:MAG: hypothetical protein ACJ746_13610 [Bryobacteraceae bacterium]
MSLLSPVGLWELRVEDLQRDLIRVEAILSHHVIEQEFALGGLFRQALGPAEVKLKELQAEDRTAAGLPELWLRLSALTRECRTVLESELELLGGLCISSGGITQDRAAQPVAWFCNVARQFLRRQCQVLGFDKRLTVISGRGPLFEENTCLVRVPFPDCELWYLPLVGRALGLAAAAPGSRFHAALQGTARHLPSGILPVLPSINDLPARNVFLDHVFADMLATAVIGPGYAVAVFALELDYTNPEDLQPLDPEPIEEVASEPRYLPAAVHRAAAILTVLDAMNRGSKRSRAPYSAVVSRLVEIWNSSVRSAGSDENLLKSERQEHGSLYRSFYDEAIRTYGNYAIKETEARWVDTISCLENLSEGRRRQLPQADEGVAATAIWLLRLDQPDLAEQAVEAAMVWLAGRHDPPRLGRNNFQPTPERVVARARLERCEQRLRRTRQILENVWQQEMPGTLAARFYRLFSAQEYAARPWLEEISRSNVRLRRSTWGKIENLGIDARPLQRESLEFLGGWLIRRQQFDREPARITKSSEGPSICALADMLLSEYARRTGVSWDARAIAGMDPLVEPNTEVVRVRFPDWSLWQLPVVGHEFGHLVARATPEFLTYREEEVEPRTAHDPRSAMNRSRQMEELFSDIFATITLGPAFACCVLLTQFDPVEAFAARGRHPPHDVRARAVLDTLRGMDAKTRHTYTEVIEWLDTSWTEAKRVCGAVPDAMEEPNNNFRRWHRKLSALVEKYYGLGAGYTPERFETARRMAVRLEKRPAPDLSELSAAGRICEHAITLSDILNALWYARLPPGRVSIDLNEVAYELGKRLEERASVRSDPR